MIPRILHFTWKTTTLPREMQDYFDKWVALHPGWDAKLWTDESMRVFVAETYPGFLATYDAYPKMIQRADAFRYLVLAALGGVYADLDVEPFQSIEPLLVHDAFLGVEPLEHIVADRKHQGVPFLLTNAFMGAVPGHRLFADIVARLPDLADQETFYSTGPSMVTAMTLRLPVEARPVLLLPEVWSPLLATGKRARTDAALKPMLEGLGTVIAADSGTLVSHKWMTTWVPWHKRGNRFSGLVQIPTRIKWWWRMQTHRDLAAIRIADPLTPYTDQQLHPVDDLPPVHIAVRSDGEPLSDSLKAAIEALDYPRDRVTFSFHDTGFDQASRRDNKILEDSMRDSRAVLLIANSVLTLSPDVLTQMLAAGRPVVAANVVTETGENADPALFRYKDGAGFKVLYKLGGATGVVRADEGFRTRLNHQKVFDILPLDGVGTSCVLIHRDVIAAGVRFAETPYKLHLGAEAFGIMARDRGFEVAGLPNLKLLKSQ